MNCILWFVLYCIECICWLIYWMSTAACCIITGTVKVTLCLWRKIDLYPTSHVYCPTWLKFSSRDLNIGCGAFMSFTKFVEGHTFLMSVNNVSTCTTPQCLPLTPPISTCTTPQCLALTPLISTRTTTQCLNLKNLSNIISFRLHILTA